MLGSIKVCKNVRHIFWFNVCLFICIVENHPGTCPVVRGAGICVEMCSSDSDCTQQQKCCSNGCGHVCMDVIPSKEK